MFGHEQLMKLYLKKCYRKSCYWKQQHKRLETREVAQTKFLAYAKHVYEGFIEGRHHRIIAEKLEDIASGNLKRLIINMPPRHSKSELASYLMPSWFLGRNPKLKIIQATMNTELAVRFGRKVRDLIADPIYAEIFPKTDLKQDSQAAGRWETSAGGEYFAAGVGAAMTGRGADLLIIDDPHSEQDALSTVAYDNTYEWYTSGPRQRLTTGGYHHYCADEMVEERFDRAISTEYGNGHYVRSMGGYRISSYTSK